MKVSEFNLSKYSSVFYPTAVHVLLENHSGSVYQRAKLRILLRSILRDYSVEAVWTSCSHHSISLILTSCTCMVWRCSSLENFRTLSNLLNATAYLVGTIESCAPLYHGRHNESSTTLILKTFQLLGEKSFFGVLVQASLLPASLHNTVTNSVD